MASSSWTVPQDYKTRPVAVLGGGVLGRRIAACWVSGGYNVRVRDPDASTRQACLDYVTSTAGSFPASQTRKGPQGSIEVLEDMGKAIKDAWLVIEAIPEKIQLKIDQFAELDRLAPKDAILASNSSSYKSSEMLAKVSDSAKARILNTHYYMPPKTMVVELMTDGHTDPAIFPFLSERQREAGTHPYVARKESTGLIFNRLWAAIKRETLSILAEGVSTPEEIDQLWNETMGAGDFGGGPCAAMDAVGLDTVAFIEDHYIQERGLSGEHTVDFLRNKYIGKGRVGNKSSKGGLFPRRPHIIALDLSLVQGTDLAKAITSGRVIQMTSDGKLEKVLVDNQCMPDGIDVDIDSGVMFWTTMGIPGEDNGQVFSAKLDGSDVKCIVPKGTVNTLKQLAVEKLSKKLYFCDREGMSVLRCNYDGSDLEVLVRNGDAKTEGYNDCTKWCVGIAVSPKHGKFYWTQKGPSKGGQGRILCASLEAPSGKGPRSDIQVLFDRLPEPIDLEIDPRTDTLYWTDRGEIPFGNSVNRAKLDPKTGLVAKGGDDGGGVQGYEIIVQHLNEAIGLTLDAENGHIYFTDLGGALYRCNTDGTAKKVLSRDEEYALTGITLF